KRGHAEAHGGSWKVAYADLVTAMMAFFLLLWLLAMVSPEKRLALSEYFQHHSIFMEQTVAGGKSFMQGSPSAMEAPVMKREKNQPGTSMGKASGETVEKKRVSSEEMAERLKDSINRKLRYLKDQILVDIVEGGVRIQILDIAGSEMFPSGSDQPTQKALQILDLVADNIRDVDNRIAVEGHTDAAPFIGGKTTNWELSTSRASAARRALERMGIDVDRIARVVGFADQELFIKENPLDPRNRRISIILLQKSGQSVSLQSMPQSINQPQQVGQTAVSTGQTPALAPGRGGRQYSLLDQQGGLPFYF
ncbi:MAG: flagellar motor protein MotB, partial [Syntrophales bacterium]|nr:flagellar motor protein MotB [Syntrophales bacterium]